MNENTIPRLENVIRALEESPVPEMFNMNKYGHDITRTSPTGTSCGTPACALGHYAYRTDLQDDFVLSTYGSVSAKAKAGYVFPCNYNWLCDHFGLDRTDIIDLFDPCGCANAKTIKEAVCYIHGFINGLRR